MRIRRAGDVPVIEVTGLASPRSLDETALRALLVDDDAAPRGAGSVMVSSILEGVDVDASATHVSVISDDRLYTASIPLSDMQAAGRLYVGRQSSLDRHAGGPFRLVVLEGRTLCWNVKAVGEFRFTAGAEADSVPENPPH